MSVIVPVFENPKGLRACLEGLARQEDPAYEVIVADDASRQDHAAICEEFRARHVRLPENRGPGEARNVGARVARGEILAFTDSDCVPPADWLSRIRAALSERGIVAVGGTYGKDLSGTFFAAQRLIEARFHHVRRRRFVNSFVSANFAIRKSVFETVGGFPPLRIGEDLLLGWRLKVAGHEVLWDDALTVDQFFRESLAAYFRQQRAWAAGAFRIRRDHPETRGMSWSVRRAGLICQLAAHGLFLASLPLALALPPCAALPPSLAGCLLAMNLPFLRHAARERSPGFAARLFLSTWWVRNTAWLLGVCSEIIRSPGAAVRMLLPRPQ